MVLTVAAGSAQGTQPVAERGDRVDYAEGSRLPARLGAQDSISQPDSTSVEHGQLEVIRRTACFKPAMDCHMSWLMDAI